MKLYNNLKEYVERLLSVLRNEAIEILSKIPNEDPTISVGPRIRKLYFETLQVLILGCFNASIVMCGLLLEALLKELLRIKKDSIEEDIKFYDSINLCRKKGYITKPEKKWIHGVRKNVRDLYQHSQVRKIVGNVSYSGKWINFKNPADLLETIKRIQSGQDTSNLDVKIEDVIKTNDEIPELGDIAKGQLDKKRALPLFLEVNNFLKEIVKRHFEKKN